MNLNWFKQLAGRILGNTNVTGSLVEGIQAILEKAREELKKGSAAADAFLADAHDKAPAIVGAAIANTVAEQADPALVQAGKDLQKSND